MSDFDKEAERQKLRDKYERDREKRKETERMSQLLLQGATMTNRHCDSCGDPLFRYEGTEFCATCEGRAQEASQQHGTTDADADTATADADGEANADGVEAEPEPEPKPKPEAVDGDAAGHPSPEATTPSENVDAASERQPTPPENEPSPATAAGSGSVRPTGDTAVGAAGTEQPTTATAATESDQGASADADLATARASLVRTLTRHAQRAEAADGPRRATDHLAAVRQAAEALSALDGTRR